MTTIYLLRHGEIESGDVRRFIGRSDVPLSSRGLDQARAWRSALADKRFEAIYASDLSRCAETARIVAANAASELHLLPELREIHLGKLEGLSMAEVRNRFPDEWTSRGKDIAEYAPEGGESFTGLQQRVMPVLREISGRHEGNVLVVAHAGVIRVILCHVLGMPVSNLFRIELSYGCLNLLSSSGDSFRVIGVNLPSPLGDPGAF